MAIDIVVPRLGWTMESGVFIGWLKQDGDTIQPGDMLYELEGEKAIQEVEATDGGILRISPDAPQPGTTIPVGTLLARLVAEGETVSWIDKSVALPQIASEPSTESRAAPSAPLPPAAPSIRRMARELGVDPTRVVCSDPAGRLSVADLHAAIGHPAAVSRAAVPQPASSHLLQASGRVTSSPRARRVAAELGVDWTQLRGTGRTGRVREQDVQAAASSRQAPRTASTADEQLPGRLLPLTPLRRTIAARMVASVHATAPVTLTATADATNLVAMRERLKKSETAVEPAPTFNDVLLMLTAHALREHPLLNAQWREDGIFLPDAIHLALAVQTEAGLVAPVIRNASDLALRELALATRELVAAAREKRLAAAKLQGGTFTLTNLGSFGIEFFTPIINVPQCAILGVGQIRREPVVYDSAIVVRQRLPLSLTFDHRVVDGAPAAQFLQRMCDLIERLPSISQH